MSANKIMALTAAAIALLLALTACGDGNAQMDRPVRVVEKSVPIIEIRPVPEELLRTPIPADQLPVFVAKDDPAASSCLTPDAEAKLRMIMIDRESRIEAWEKWGILP